MNRRWLSSLAGFLKDNNIDNIITSPGSRNAPLLLHLTNYKEINIYSHVDERSAGYMALGMAQYLRTPVALVCTSGSAMLNYGPALSEAYYQHIPLLVLTADRAPEWIDQSDGQTIRQNNIFQAYIRKSFTLPTDINHPDDEWYIWRTLSEAIKNTTVPVPGPVHVNIPFREPLYEIEAQTNSKPKLLTVVKALRNLDEAAWNLLIPILNKSKHIIILAGLNQPDKITTDLLKILSGFNQVAVFTDISSNQTSKTFIRASDDIIASVINPDHNLFDADLLISFGGPVISKSLKTWLRKHPPAEHWHLNRESEAPDTFQCLNKIIESDINPFLEGLIKRLINTDSVYSWKWRDINDKVNNIRDLNLEKSLFSDIKACWLISKKIPDNSLLHLANSMPVRYAHLNNWPENISIYSNRGVSGIEGCVSTAVGAAIHFRGITSVITGDLAMLYDSHSLWNETLPGGLKIIVLNNQGGGIFRIIDGPGKHKAHREYFETPHHYNLKSLAEMYNLNYFGTHNESELNEALNIIYNDINNPALLEIFTDQDVNADVYHNYIKKCHIAPYE